MGGPLLSSLALVHGSSCKWLLLSLGTNLLQVGPRVNMQSLRVLAVPPTGCSHRPAACCHALLLRDKVVLVAMAATIPEPVALADNSYEVPANGPVYTGAMGAGQQTPDWVGYQQMAEQKKMRL